MHAPCACFFDLRHQRWLSFRTPEEVISISAINEVAPALAEADRLVRERGLWAAGFISYEAGPAFDPALQTHTPGPAPLLWLGLFPEPELLPPPAAGALPGTAWQADTTWQDYAAAISAIKDHIACGNTYQVNYTIRLRTGFTGDAWSFFAALVHGQGVGPAAFIDTGRFAVCSASPELFFALNGDRLLSRPMKGTHPRGRSTEEDRAHVRRLAASGKDQAENVMIVDMVRNDLGRIARTGSVAVPALFEVERYPTVLQMTSTVTCRTEAPIPEILAALFPCASITGAPKIRTMGIIRDLEAGPRGVYTGAAGFWAPASAGEPRRAQFNVAIRTAVIDRQAGEAVYGSGGGIVWDSQPDAEYRECLLKTQVLSARRPAFDLLETMRWSSAGGYLLLDRHMDRLAGSAEYFGFAFDADRVRAALDRVAAAWPSAEDRKVRLLVDKDGSWRIESEPLPGRTVRLADLLSPSGETAAAAAAAAAPIDTADVTLYHKTTHRQVYAEAEAGRPEADYILLWNESGEAAEFTTANLVARIGGALVTPPVRAGLLPGTLRAELLDRRRVVEREIRLQALEGAEAIWAVNSVRGWQAVRLISRPASGSS